MIIISKKNIISIYFSTIHFLHESWKYGIARFSINASNVKTNLKREIPENVSFEQLVEDGKLVWNNELSKIKVTSKESEKTNEDLIKFYSSLYRTILFPRQFHEYKVDGKQIHYSPYNGEILEGPLYTDNGFWDTCIFNYIMKHGSG